MALQLWLAHTQGRNNQQSALPAQRRPYPICTAPLLRRDKSTPQVKFLFSQGKSCARLRSRKSEMGCKASHPSESFWEV